MKITNVFNQPPDINSVDSAMCPIMDEDSFNELRQEARERQAYLAVFMLSLLFVFTLFTLYYNYFKKPIDNYRKKNNAVNKMRKTLEKINEEKSQHQNKAMQLDKIASSSQKRWDENKKDLYYDEKQLNELLEIINANNSEPVLTPSTSTSEASTHSTANAYKKQNRFGKYNKVEAPSASIPKTIQNDRILTWDDALPSYNLTKHAPTDSLRPVYALKSGNKFVFINRYLLQYLQLNNSTTLTALLKLCDKGKDQLPKGHRQVGFIMREEKNAKKLDKTLDVLLKVHQQEKKTDASNKIYIKAKPTMDARFFGASAAIKSGMTLFEINGIKHRHKDKNALYFPSETTITRKMAK